MPALLACRVFRDMRLKAWAMQEKNMPTLATLSTSGGSGMGIRQGQVEDCFSTEVVYEMTKINES
ncbi:hypothetical protein FIBSPDRAFT_880657 [Athelia psychrophila]|uniref:Uncharacterized protein n=1 Tax=Athelia psychrophila TaxID=1759441 RepID=A0A167SJ09_9AGAM|nr:hypothetical protein FIBSPDRAFT_880657 [Fibularhizoctonia sp. CBS 109695]